MSGSQQSDSRENIMCNYRSVGAYIVVFCLINSIVENSQMGQKTRRNYTVNQILNQYKNFCIFWENFNIDDRRGTSPKPARLITSDTNDVRLPVEYAFFYEILIELQESQQFNFSLDELIEKLPDMERLYKQLLLIKSFDPQLTFMPDVIKLPSGQLKKLCDAYDDYDQFKINYWSIIYGGDSDFVSHKKKAKKILYRLMLNNPDSAQSTIFLVMLSSKLHRDEPREFFAKINSIADLSSQTDKVARFMLKLLGIAVDLAYERLGDFFSAINYSALLLCDDDFYGFFNLAFKNSSRISDKIIDSLELFPPTGDQQALEKNYYLLSEHGFEDTPIFTIDSVLYYQAYRNCLLSEVGIASKQDLDSEKFEPRLIPYYKLRKYFTDYLDQKDDLSLTLLSKGHPRAKYWLEKIASLGDLTWARYEAMMLELSDKERQVLFDSFQCREVLSAGNNIEMRTFFQNYLDLHLNKPYANYLFLSCQPLQALAGFDYNEFPPLPESDCLNKIELFRRDFSDGTACSSVHRYNLMLLAMWCKNQESLDCGRMLGMICSTLNIPYSNIVSSSVLHENVQQGLLESINPTKNVQLQFFNDRSEPHWQKTGKGFSQVVIKA